MLEWTDSRLADFIEGRVAEDLRRQGRGLGSLAFYAKELLAAEMCGHQWNNLAAILQGLGLLIGQNYSAAVAYCLSRERGLKGMSHGRGANRDLAYQ